MHTIIMTLIERNNYIVDGRPVHYWNTIQAHGRRERKDRQTQQGTDQIG